MANGEDDEDLLDDTLDDGAEQRKADRQQRKQRRQNTKETVKRADEIIGKAVGESEGFLSKFLTQIKAKLAPMLGTAATIALIIFVAIGLIAFILSIPNFMRDKFNEIIGNVDSAVKTALYGNNYQLEGEVINKEKRKELLNYISSDLGFDVVGFGFVPFAVYDDNNSENIGKQKIIDYDSKLGYIDSAERKNDEKSSNPDADLMYYYLMANERAYTINSGGLLGDGLIAHVFGTENAWQGMINIDKNAFDKINDYLENKDIEIFVDRDQKLLVVKNHQYDGIFAGIPILRGLQQQIDNFTFSMDGWTGRYGMPLEFSLALHVSTMSSGLVKEMITNPDLQAQVNLGLQSVKCDVDFKFYIDMDGTLRELTYRATERNGGVKHVYDKIVKNERVDYSELNVENILYAKKMFSDKYTFYLDGFPYNSGIHVEAMEALLSDRYIAVSLKPGDSTASGYKYEIEELIDVTLNPGSYGLYSGAYVCMYNGDLSPDTSTGKLAFIDRPIDESARELGYSEYSFISEDDAAAFYWYKNYRQDPNGRMEENPDYYNPSYLVIPKGGRQEENGQGVICVSALGMSDANNLTSFAHKDENNKVYLAYRSMFEEFDWFLMCARHTKDIQGLIYADGQDIYDNLIYDPDSVLFYTNKFDELVDEESQWYNNQGHLELLKSYMQHDLDIIMQNLDSEPEAKQRFDSLMEEYGINLDTLQVAANQFEATGALSVKELIYTQPYIKRVIKHWFKDVIFEDEDLDYISYEVNSDPFELDYRPEGDDPRIDGVDIRVLLTPQNEGEGIYVQKEQPYVVKGDLVLKDGLAQDVDVSNIDVDDGYHYGDGYRATKKLFTKGFYYTFDGSQATSKSVFWQQQIENMPAGSQLFVTVVNGRIYNVTGSEHIELDKTAEELEAINSTNPFPSMSGITYAGTIEPRFDDNGNLLRGGGYKFYLTVDSQMKYISPTEEGVSYSQVQERVKHINEVWDAIGVSCHRQHVSFDNETSTGEVMANTGLAILKNCETRDAEYIYRDLKEMLIDLGYYTEAEFDALDVKLKWFIPRYNPKQWPQNSAEDFKFASVLRPADPNATEENEENQGPNFTLKATTDKGFREGLPVVAPGACIVKDVSGDTIVIEFDGVAQPSISSMHKYKMTITGIVPTVAKGAVLAEGEQIAETSTKEITVFLQNDLGRPLSNVSDYMSPKITDVPELAYFYFLPFESGGKPGTVGGRNGNEVAVGLVQWTVLPGMNNISPLCQYLYEEDPSLCAPLQTFISWSDQDIINDYFSGNSQLVKAFAEVQEADIEAFRTLQLQYALEEKKRITSNLGCEWIMEMSPATVGTFFSLINWGPYMGWQNVIDPGMSDEEIIWNLLAYACTKNSTAGSLNSRWTTQYVLALDLLYDSTPKDFDLEKFVFGEMTWATYSNGAHMDAIEKDRGLYGK